MSAPRKILAISGSLRAGSRNTALLRAAIALNDSTKLAIEHYDISSIPLYNQDLENVSGSGEDAVTTFPESVAALRAAVESADGLILVSPEHNFIMSTAMKNVIDWLSRGKVLAGKTVGIMSAAGGSGGAGAAGSIENILIRLTWLNIKVVSQRVEVKLFDGIQKFNDQDELVHEETIGYIKRMLDELSQ
jgi:chromate reductase